MKIPSLLLVFAAASFSLVSSEEHGRIGSAVSSRPNDIPSNGVVSRKLEDENIGDEFEDDPWDNGTEVLKVVGDNSLYGEITGYQNGMYNIVWEDGTSGLYSVEETNDFVEADEDEETDVPTGEDTDSPTEEDTEEETDMPMMNGAEEEFETDFPTEGESETEVPSEEATDAETEVPSEEATDAETEVPSEEDTEAEDDPWRVGTDVYKVFDDGPYFGKIIGYEEGYYSVRWSDGEVEEYSERDIDRLVEAAATQVRTGNVASQTGNLSVTGNNDGIKRGGVAALVVFFVIIAAYCGCKRCRKQKEREFDTNKLPDPCYMDDPESELEMGGSKGDALPKFD